MKEVWPEVCLELLTRHWKKHPKRGEEKLFEFLMACFKLSPAEMEQFEFFTRLKVPKLLMEKEREAWAKKTIAQIKCRGLDSLQLLMISDLFDEWWNGEWEIKKRRFVRREGELHRRNPRENLKKANKAKSDKAKLKRLLEKQRKREEKRLEKERIARAWKNLLKPQPSRKYI